MKKKRCHHWVQIHDFGNDFQWPHLVKPKYSMALNPWPLNNRISQNHHHWFKTRMFTFKNKKNNNLSCPWQLIDPEEDMSVFWYGHDSVQAQQFFLVIQPSANTVRAACCMLDGCQFPWWDKSGSTYSLWWIGPILDMLPAWAWFRSRSGVFWYFYKGSIVITEAHFTNDLWAYDWNLVEICIALIPILMSKTGNNFAHATTAQLSWHVQKYDLIGSLFFM